MFHFDWIVVGSGFGGGVAALRLADKGYRVGVLEAGRRFDGDDFPRSTWDSADSSRGVIDEQHRVFGYHNLLVCDGAAVPANVRVNPALTIAALAERALTFLPSAGETASASGAGESGRQM